MIPESFIEQLKEASPIDSVIGSYTTLKRRGRNLVGLCPFHSEKTPSFTVFPEDRNPHYHCFGCGSGGDVITFVRNIENLEYIEALKFLAARAGLTLPEDGVDDRAAKQKTRILELNRKTARFYYQQLTEPGGRSALAYLTGRGLSLKTIKRFGLGYAPDSWDSLRNHLRQAGFSEEEMLLAAVANKGRNGGVYDSFRGRVMFPIIDLRGNVIGFGGRAMEDGKGPKYLNSADTPVFRKSRNLFALSFAKKTEAEGLILAEGYMDVIAMHQAGFDNAVATLGTALTSEQSRLLAQYARGKKVYLAYDSDGAGQTATKRAINLLGETDVTVNVLEIQGAKDPDEYIKKFGPQRFGNLLTAGKGALNFEIDKLKAGFDLDSAEGKAEYLRAFCDFIAGIGSELQRDVYISEAARELEVGKDAILGTVRGIRKRRRQLADKKNAHNYRVYAQDNAGDRRKIPQSSGLQGYVAEEKLLMLLMNTPEAYGEIAESLTPDDFQTADYRDLYRILAQRLAERRSVEPIHLAEEVSTELMGRLSGLLAAGREVQFLPGQAGEYAAAIKTQKDVKTTEEVKNMSPQGWSDYITSLAAKKK